jgi:hypothetical protein
MYTGLDLPYIFAGTIYGASVSSTTHGAAGDCSNTRRTMFAVFHWTRRRSHLFVSETTLPSLAERHAHRYANVQVRKVVQQMQLEIGHIREAVDMDLPRGGGRVNQRWLWARAHLVLCGHLGLEDPLGVCVRFP